ncbi:hypothetical protein D3C85_384050 [compost metagenome]
MLRSDAFAEIVADIRQELANATEALLAFHEAGLRDIALLRDGDDTALSRLEGGLMTVLELCAFEDLIGQRLTQLCSAAPSTEPSQSAPDSLENGPSLRGQGLGQAQIDDLLREDDPKET